MKPIHQILIILAATLTGLTACEKNEMHESGNGNIAIMPELPGMYAVSPGNRTNTRATEKDKHPGLSTIINLPEGSTLRLIAKKDKGQTTLKDYVVRTSSGGSQSLYPCELNEKGEVIGLSKEPLYLNNGRYTFSAISPAHKYNNGITINNGESVIASNSNWSQTEPITLDISKDDASKVIPLNPLMQLTARMTFTIKGDISNGISSLSVMQDGIEIDRVRENAVHLNNVGDSIPAIITANYNRVRIKEKEIIAQDDKSLRGEICLLPIDNRPTPMFVILNLLVNGVPTQFTYSIVNKVLYAGYSYNYTVNVKIKDNITVANWQETSWSTDVESDETVVNI